MSSEDRRSSIRRSWSCGAWPITTAQLAAVTASIEAAMVHVLGRRTYRGPASVEDGGARADRATLMARRRAPQP